jgi:hypothetical protein
MKISRIKKKEKKNNKAGKIGKLKETFTKEGKVGQEGTGGNISLYRGKKTVTVKRKEIEEVPEGKEEVPVKGKVSSVKCSRILFLL